MAVLQFASVKVCATMAAVYSRAVGEAWNGRIEQGDNIVIHDFYILGGLLGGGGLEQVESHTKTGRD